MKSIIKHILFVVLIAQSWCILAQNDLGKMDDLSRISLTPVIADQADNIPVSAISLLQNKMQQVAANNGLSAVSFSPRFVITANLNVITQNVVAGPPTMTAMNIDVTFYIADYNTKTVFSSRTTSLKAVGTNINKAYINGINGIDINSKELKSFVEEGKSKIIAFYNDRCDFILQESKALASQKQHQEAIFLLMSVPDVCKDCYIKATNAVEPIFKSYLDDLCNKNLAAARAVWIANPNSYGANEIAGLLAEILPDANCYGDAQKLVSDISKKILADEKRDWNFQLKQWNDNVSLESQRINAYREVGVAFGTHQPQNIYHFRGWLW